MKKILLLTCLFIALYPGKGKSSDRKETNPHRWVAVRQYYEQHVKPVLIEKRKAFDAFLNASERYELNDCRLQIREWHESIHKTTDENSGTLPERNSMVLSDEMRNKKHQHVKELMGRIHTIAKNHPDELDKIFLDLTVQRKQWVDDISKLLSVDEEKPLSFLKTALDDKGGLLRMWSRAAFLLLDPSTAISADNNKVAASDILPASISEGLNMFPNPAIDHFTLNLANVPADNKLTISDMAGKTMMEKENLSSTESIDCSGFPAGIYFVQLRSGDEVTNRKLIINH